MSHDNENWPVRGRNGRITRLKETDARQISGAATGFGRTVQRLTYISFALFTEFAKRNGTTTITELDGISLDEINYEKLRDYPVVFTAAGYTALSNLSDDELQRQITIKIEQVIPTLVNQLTVYYNELERRESNHPESLFEQGIDNWISNKKDFAKSEFFRDYLIE